jgi:hypothetical protein
MFFHQAEEIKRQISKGKGQKVGTLFFLIYLNKTKIIFRPFAF